MDWLQFCNGKFSLTGLHGNYLSYVNEYLVIPEVNISLSILAAISSSADNLCKQFRRFTGGTVLCP